MRWGQEIEYLEKLREDMGIMPLGLVNRPERHELGEAPYRAFNVLSSSRSYGMSGPLPITISDIAAYCELFEIADLDEREAFVSMMQRLDGTYLKLAAERSATKTSSAVVGGDGTADNSAKG